MAQSLLESGSTATPKYFVLLVWHPQGNRDDDGFHCDVLGCDDRLRCPWDTWWVRDLQDGYQATNETCSCSR